VAQHERCYERGQQILDLEHYLDVLERKPGALAGSKPLAQWREQGRWPASFDRLWHSLQQRHGKQQGAREMIELLQLGRQHGYLHLQAAVEAALESGCTDAGAVRYLLRAQGLAVALRPEPRPPLELLEGGALARYERPLPVLHDYEQLLGGACDAGTAWPDLACGREVA
jgi:hypothetical protein